MEETAAATIEAAVVETAAMVKMVETAEVDIRKR
jgi:hypothetical protein